MVGAANPIFFPLDNVIQGTPTSTAATWDGSGFSSHGVHLVAAGGTLENPERSTVGDGLGVMAGTSVATAKVTAVVAQVWAANPELSYGQVWEILQSTVTERNNYMRIKLESGFEVLSFFPIEYEGMVTEIQYQGEIIAQINEDRGEGLFEIDIFMDPARKGFIAKFLLGDFLLAVDEATKLLEGYRSMTKNSKDI